MSAGIKIFHNALKIIGAYSSAAPADAEADVDMMDIYNAMIESWHDDEIMVPLTPIKVPGEEIGEPHGIRLALEYNLAVLAFPRFHTGKTLSSTIKGQARYLLGKIKSVYQDVTIEEMVVSSTLHRGEGVHPQESNGPYFDRDETIGN